MNDPATTQQGQRPTDLGAAPGAGKTTRAQRDHTTPEGHTDMVRRLGDYDATSDLRFGLSVAHGFTDAKDRTITAKNTAGSVPVNLVLLLTGSQQTPRKPHHATEALG